MAVVIVHRDFGAQENKICHCFHFSSFCLSWSDGTRCHDLSFLSVKLSLSLSSFTFIRRLFSSSLLSAIRLLSWAYLVLITLCHVLGLCHSFKGCALLSSFQTPSSNNTRENSTHGHHQMVNTEIRLIIFFAAKDGEALYSQQNQDWELTVAQIMNSLLPNSDLNWRK